MVYALHIIRVFRPTARRALNRSSVADGPAIGVLIWRSHITKYQDLATGIYPAIPSAMLTNSQILAVYKTAERAVRATLARYSVRVTRDLLADLQQGTLEKLVKSYDAERGNPDQLAWRIAANEATSYLRGRTVGAIKNDDQSLTATDDDGKETTVDIADDSCNAFELVAARQLDGELTRGIAGLTEGLQAGIKAALSGETMEGSDRIAAMRARESLAESLKASHFPLVREAKKPAKRAKSSKRAPKVETTEATVVPSLRRMATVVRMEMELMMLHGMQLTVLGPYVASAE